MQNPHQHATYPASHTPAYDDAGYLVDDGQYIYRYDAWNRLVKVRAKHDDVTIQTAAYDGTERRIKKVVSKRGDLDATEVYYYDGWKIVEIRNGSDAMDRQFIHGTQYIDEHIMMRAAGKGDLYIHQGERSERERAAIGKAGRDARVRPATCPQVASTKRAAGGANWNVIATTNLGGNLMEHYVYEPYGSLTVNQSTSWGDRDGDGDVDSTDKGTVGVTCTGTVSGACRILDLDFDGDYDNDDAGRFDNLAQGVARKAASLHSRVGQPMAHHGLRLEPESSDYQSRRRQYDPSKGRFPQADPAMYKDSLSLFTYARSNPCKYVDPTGLTSCCVSSGGGNSPTPEGDAMGGWVCCTCIPGGCQLEICIDPDFEQETDSDLVGCVVEHEMDHARRGRCELESGGGCAFRSTVSETQDECFAYRAEERCLEDLPTNSDDRYDQCNHVKCMVDRICGHGQNPYGGSQSAQHWCETNRPDYGGCANS
ncbi:MAG: hypothetical protein J5J06_18920 [Phycisphaerae bacterium]|nr:hypothetical protein [Phycisphaerae bacterium]